MILNKTINYYGFQFIRKKFKNNKKKNNNNINKLNKKLNQKNTNKFYSNKK